MFRLRLAFVIATQQNKTAIVYVLPLSKQVLETIQSKKNLFFNEVNHET